MTTRRASQPEATVTIPESKVQAAAIAMLRSFGCVVHRRNTGAMEASHKGKRRFVRFSEKGAADVYAITPAGYHLEVEIKRRGERPTLDQVNWLIAHNGIGGAAAIWVDNTDTLARVYRHIEAGGRVVYLDEVRTYTVKQGKRSARVIGPSGNYDLA
jgi:hypothetical protein